MQHIKNFSDCPDVLPMVAEWIYQEFWVGKRSGSANELLEKFRQGKRDSLPMGFVIFDEDIPVGTASIIDCDLEERSDLSPWLAAVYVTPNARNSGLGKLLIQHCIREAGRIGFSELYLFTSLPEYYERLGGIRIGVTSDSKTILSCSVAS